MEIDSTKSPLRNAYEMLSGTVCFKLRFFEELFLDYSSGGGIELTGPPLEGLTVMMRELAEQVEQAEALLSKAVGEEYKQKTGSVTA